MDLSFIFDGIGSTIVGTLVGCLVGYGAGRHSMRQKQKAGDESIQIQVGSKNGK